MQKKLQEQNSRSGLYIAQLRRLFHADIRIKIPIEYDMDIFDDLFGVMERIDQQYNSYQAGSFIDKINKNAGNWTLCDETTVNILKEIKYWSAFFKGSYDITAMPLLKLWGFYHEGTKKMPSEAAIAQALNLVDFRKIEISDSNLVRIAPGQQLLTGSFLKAYAVDRTIEKMQSLGIKDGIINAGGSTIYGLNKDKNHPFWKIEVPDPTNPSKGLFELQLSNACFSTSAAFGSHVEINGQRWGHIFDARSGYPSSNLQTCLLTADCFHGDLLSTALFIEDAENFQQKISIIRDKLDIAGFHADGKGKLSFSLNFPKPKYYYDHDTFT